MKNIPAISPPGRPPRSQVLMAYLAVYLIWGSTYLAIRFAIETIPPFLMAGARQFLAGVILIVLFRGRSSAPIEQVHWKSAFMIGLTLLVVGNGGLSWAEQRVPSGIASLIIASIPAWFVLLQLVQHSVRPTSRTLAGLVLGSIGTIILVDPAQLTGTGSVDLVGAAVLLFASVGWAYGSLSSRTAVQASPPLLATGLQMLAGGLLLLVLGVSLGELHDFSLAAVSLRSAVGFFYLVVFGSLIAYSCYIWLLRVSKPSNVATYAYVNPVVAILLGWLLADEPMNLRIVAATVITVGAVALLIGSSLRRAVSGSAREAH